MTAAAVADLVMALGCDSECSPFAKRFLAAAAVVIFPLKKVLSAVETVIQNRTGV